MTKYTSEERIKIYEAWKQSGLNPSKFCQQNAIRLPTFYTWVKKIKSAAEGKSLAPSSEEIKFLPIGNIISDQSFLEITLPTGINFKAHLSEERMNTFLERLIK